MSETIINDQIPSERAGEQISSTLIDPFSLGGLFSHFEPRDILWRNIIFSNLKLFLHISAITWKFESKNSPENFTWSGKGQITQDN